MIFFNLYFIGSAISVIALFHFKDLIIDSFQEDFGLMKSFSLDNYYIVVSVIVGLLWLPILVYAIITWD